MRSSAATTWGSGVPALKTTRALMVSASTEGKNTNGTLPAAIGATAPAMKPATPTATVT